MVKQIHHEQCYEVELEKKLCGKMHYMSSRLLETLVGFANFAIILSSPGIEIDLPRTKLNADEQMCW